MKQITLDFETYYDADYSLSKLTTEAYVRDPRFEAILVGIKIDGGPTRTATGPNILRALAELDIPSSVVLCHHSHFDGLILCHHYGLRPRIWLDTLPMARAHIGSVAAAGLSLDALITYLKVGVPKGTYVLEAKGKRLADFLPHELQSYREYCRDDVENTYLIGELLRPCFTVEELQLIDLTTRIFTEPLVELDIPLLEEYKAEVLANKVSLLMKAGIAERGDLVSNNKFADILRRYNVEPPLKKSLRTGKMTYAFAKSDDGMKELLEHPEETIRVLAEARIGVKTSIAETRAQTLMDMASRGPATIYLQYWGAEQTGRHSARDKANFLNLGRPVKLEEEHLGAGQSVVTPVGRTTTIEYDGLGTLVTHAGQWPAGKCHRIGLRDALRAPEGYRLVVGDSANIEARMVCWIAGQMDILEKYVDGADLYCDMATDIFGRPVIKDMLFERQLGKIVVLACFAEDTKVLTHTGTKRIVDVLNSDMVWDGVEWVNHQGVVCRGEKKIERRYAVSATADHEILTERGWQEWHAVHTQENLFRSALRSATLPLSASESMFLQEAGTTDINLCVAAPAEQKTSWCAKASRKTERLAAISAQKLQVVLKDIGHTLLRCLTISIGADYVTEYQHVSAAATTQRTSTTNTTESGVSVSTKHGGSTRVSFLSMCRRYQGGISRILKWIAKITNKDMSRAISDLSHEEKTSKTEDRSSACSERSLVYDLLLCGPRQRFTVLSSEGPVIVHNCGFGMGPTKFLATANAPPWNAKIDEPLAVKAVYTFRRRYFKVQAYWKFLNDTIIPAMASGKKIYADSMGLITTQQNALLLPSGRTLKYPNLRREMQYELLDDGTKIESGEQWVFDVREGRRLLATKLYGGKLCENIVQALARNVVMPQGVKISRRYRVVHLVYDEVVTCVPSSKVVECTQYMKEVLTTTPAWATGLPLGCSVDSNDFYGGC